MLNADFQKMEQMDEQELYRVIGSSVTATYSISDYQKSYTVFCSIANETDPTVATAQLNDHLEDKGKSWFSQIMTQLKNLICTTYAVVTETPGPSGPLHDTIKAIWEAIKSKIGTWPELAVKAALYLIGKLFGFDKYCGYQPTPN